MFANILDPVLLSALVIGFLGSGHCIGMCGGIASALAFAIPEKNPKQRVFILLAYNFGRILSYSALGALVGFLGQEIGLPPVLRIVAGVLLIAMGLYLANWWRGLVYLEKAGSYLWRWIQPFGAKLMPVDNMFKGLLFGVIWGWLPCGLVYSALALSMAQAEPISAAAIMLYFGLGTLPAVFLSGWAANYLKLFLQSKLVRTFFALAIILFGVWTLWMPLSHVGGHGAHVQHADPSAGATKDHNHHSM